jgi:hypothetical protein
MVVGLPSFTLLEKICHGCLVGKQPRSSFNKSLPMRSLNVEVLHSNVCGLFYEKSLGGNKYFITFVDDYSRKLCIYFIKAKEEVFDIFKKFKLRVENQSNRKMRTLKPMVVVNTHQRILNHFELKMV